MASTSEVGHNKNVANFGYTCQIVTEMGSMYNPSNVNIKLPALTTMNTAIGLSMDNISIKIPIYKNLVADRDNLISPLPSLVTRIYNYSKSTSITKNDEQHIFSIVKKMRGGSGKKKVADPAVTATKSISTSQRSIDNMVGNFKLLIDQVSSFPSYLPNEEDLQIASLEGYYNNLKSLNSQVNGAIDTLITARKDRDDLLYNNENNVILLVNDIKAYLKSLGANARPYYKAVVALKFKKM